MDGALLTIRASPESVFKVALTTVTTLPATPIRLALSTAPDGNADLGLRLSPHQPKALRWLVVRSGPVFTARAVMNEREQLGDKGFAAFISYSHQADVRLGPALRDALHQFARLGIGCARCASSAIAVLSRRRHCGPVSKQR